MQFEHFFYGVCYYPEVWDESRHESDIARIADAGFNFVRMGESAWSHLEPEEGHFRFDLFDRVIDLCRKRDIRVIFGTPTYACPAWAATNYPEILRWNFQRLPMKHGGRRNMNYTSPKMLDLSDRICTALADHYRGEKQIIGWQLDNEFNCHMDVSYAPTDTVAFQSWCRKKYGSLDELNRRWGTAFWSQTYGDWTQIDLPHPTVAYLNPSVVMDESRFISDTVVSFARRQAAILRKRNADWFITHNGIFSNIDPPELVRDLDFFSHDQYPQFFSNWQAFAELLVRSRSLSFPFAIMEQQSGPGGQMDYMHATPRSGQMRLWTLQSVVHGANMLGYFRWRTCPFGSEQHWHGLLDPDDRDNRRLAEAKTAGVELARLPADFFAAAAIRCVAVERDYENEINDWRVNTYPAAAKVEYRWWIAEFLSRHLPVDEVWPTSDWNGYSLIVAAHHKMTDQPYVEKIRQFVTAGGTVVFAAQSGSKTKDVHLVSVPLPGMLSELAGIEIEDWTFLPAEIKRSAILDGSAEAIEFNTFVERIKLHSATAVATWQADDSLLAAAPAVTVNRVGNGRVFYIGGYAPPIAITALVGYFMHSLALRPIVLASTDVECIRRRGVDFSYTCLLNHGSIAHTVHGSVGGTDLLSGNATSPHGVTLQPTDVVIIASTEK